jgi:predicted transcriptional regulator
MPAPATLPAMSTHEAVQTILQQLPPDVSLHEVAREIEFIAGVRDGFAELDRGEGVSIDEVRAKLREWVKS